MNSVQVGKYQLIAELGRGGMANVYLAVTTSPLGFDFSKLVVVKKLREHLKEDSEFVTMLLDEARIAARLNHPNVVQTLEVGEDRGEFFIAMEYLDGQALRRVLSRADKRGGFPLVMQIAIMRDSLAGLHHAHTLKDFDGTPLNIVHRDVTPQNILVTYDGQTKVLDFGIAKAAGRASQTRQGVLKGKVPYMAPEQTRGKGLDHRVDVFAVGVMLWEAATGQRFWAGKKDIDILRALATGQLRRSPREVRPDVHPILDEICQRALAPNPDERFGSAEQMAVAIDKYFAQVEERPAPSAIGAQVSELFADRIAETKSVIEGQLSRLKSGARPAESTGSLPPATRSSQASVSAESPTVAPTRGSRAKDDTAPHPKEIPLDQPSTGASAPVVVNQPALPAPAHAPQPSGDDVGLQKARLIALVVIALGAMATLSAGLIAWRISGRTDGLPTVPSAPTSSEPTAALDAASPNQPGEPIAVKLRASPPETKFTIDDGVEYSNPYEGEMVRDGKYHTIRASADGYVDQVEQVKFDGDVRLRFFLARANKPR